jgi:hypothetical protein
MRSGDLWLSVRQRKLPCVIDPALALCDAHGPRLARQLTQVVEPWLTRSFWQAIDASELLLRAPARELGAQTAAAAAGAASKPLPGALLEWMALRENTDAGSWLFRWVGDCFAESQTQDAADARVVMRYEALAEAFAARLAQPGPGPHWVHVYDPVGAAMDAVVLSATLFGAAVLGPLAGEPEPTPWPAQALQRARVSVQQIETPAAPPVFAAERMLLHEALAVAGLAPMLELMPPLAVLHAWAGDEGEDPWRQAHAWWYRL